MSRILTEEEVKNIVEQSGIEDIVIKSWYKEFLNVCPKGKMVFNPFLLQLQQTRVIRKFKSHHWLLKDKRQFYKFYKILRGQSENNLSKITDHVFASFDKDSNGYLDFSEFLIAYAATSNGEARKKLEFVFLFYVIILVNKLMKLNFLKFYLLLIIKRIKTKMGL